MRGLLRGGLFLLALVVLGTSGHHSTLSGIHGVTTLVADDPKVGSGTGG